MVTKAESCLGNYVNETKYFTIAKKKGGVHWFQTVTLKKKLQILYMIDSVLNLNIMVMGAF